MNWSEKKLNELKQAGKIRGFNINDKRKGFSADDGRQPRNRKSKALDWLHLNIAYWCNERGLELRCADKGGELRFDENRRWRFDFAIPALKIAIEYEGGIFLAKSGHNTSKHYTKDTDKYNRAVVLGWRVIRVTALNYTTVLKQLNELVK